MRIFLTYVLPLLMPTVLYVLYLVVSRQVMSGKGELAETLRRVPWLWLLGGGLVLVGVSLAIYSLTAGGETHRPYVPPHVEDGQVVPGHLD
jgi:hypothetical protein